MSDDNDTTEPGSVAYRSNHPWSAADGDELFGGFARVLRYGTSGLVYRDAPTVRANARSEWQKPASTPPAKPAPSTPRPRWTQERIDALPRTSGALTRLGDALESGRKQNPFVRCACAGGSLRCAKTTLVAASVYASSARPKSCKPCAYARKKAMSAFTVKGYAQAREYAERERAA